MALLAKLNPAAKVCAAACLPACLPAAAYGAFCAAAAPSLPTADSAAAAPALAALCKHSCPPHLLSPASLRSLPRPRAACRCPRSSTRHPSAWSASRPRQGGCGSSTPLRRTCGGAPPQITQITQITTAMQITPTATVTATAAGAARRMSMASAALCTMRAAPSTRVACCTARCRAAGAACCAARASSGSRRGMTSWGCGRARAARGRGSQGAGAVGRVTVCMHMLQAPADWTCLACCCWRAAQHPSSLNHTITNATSQQRAVDRGAA